MCLIMKMCHIRYRLLIVLCLMFMFVCCISVEVLNDAQRVVGNQKIHIGEKTNVILNNMQKRGDVDVSTCIENFDIHKDKIIRTTDSRAMGAKYLNEIDLDTREECLRLCCETDNCDVFVYEEKNSGSCYLFQCGPPEDFKCKFTHHVNYTSAVLAINRHLPDLESQIRLTKHELELSKLRKPEITNSGNVEIVPQQPTTLVPKPTATKPTTINTKIQNGPVDAAKAKAPLSEPDRKCKEYQFECRSTGECIAIYNACDGIPQCADGSDEGPELKCPDTTTLGPQFAQQQQLSAPVEPQRLQPPSVLQANPGDLYRQQIQQHAAVPKPPTIDNRQQPDFLRPVSDPLNPLHGPQYDPQQLAQYPYLAPGQTNWGHQLPQQMPQQYGQFPNKNSHSHIFNHKENGLQVPDVGESSQMQYSPDGREYQKFPNYYGTDVYGQQIPQMQQLPENNWPNNNNNNQPVADFRANGLYSNQEMNSGGRETWSQNIPQSVMKNEANQMIYNKPATKELLHMNEKEIPKHEQEKVADELKNSKQHFPNVVNTNNAVKTQTAEHSPNDGHDHGHGHDLHEKYVVAEYKIAAEVIEDGISETPGGAVLSLTLGLILTALMGVLIGCRLRVVRRRLRRGGKSYAHDADYLVNGMYL